MISYKENQCENVSACIYCNSESNQELYQLEDYVFKSVEGAWSLVRCINCKSVYLKNRPKEEYIGEAYNVYFTHSNYEMDGLVKKISNLITSNIANKNQSMLEKMWFNIIPLIWDKYPLFELLKQKPGTILDVGCGHGLLLSILKENAWDVHGVEIDGNAVENARSKGLKIEQGDYRKINKIDMKFDVIVSTHVIEHVYSPVEFINTLLAACNVGGEIYITYPNPNSVVGKCFKKYWFGYDAPRHVGLPSIEWIRDEVHKSGASVEIIPSKILTVWGSINNITTKLSLVSRLIGKVLQLIPAVCIKSKYSDVVQIKIKKS